ncbi:MAG TPA: carboxypeptidase regulatory-like domain-containing protein, partial [Puia sp.]|nr:carboxypeptidase regulatory-like domain-containing protein [Puia sp.]
MRTHCLLLILCISGFFIASPAFAQETTATLSGRVNDEKGLAVQGASVVVKHEPTGFTTGTQTNNKGIFVIPNLRSGGPYTVRISYTGFQEQVLDNINLILGNNPDLNIGIKSEDKSLKEVVVLGNRRGGGSGLTVGREQLKTLPTLGRSLGDYTRLTPQSNNNSFAGSNFRYNNFTLDGAINNDAIGFSNSFGGQSGGGQSGTAGSGTRTNPYSIETIQEVQVQLAPYDVKIGNFTGGSVNAVTKTGTNDFHGSLYGYGRNQALVGKSVDGRKTSIGSDFHDYQAGFTIGGPLIKNKAFFFINGEITRRTEPSFYNAGDPGAAISLAEAQQISSDLKTKYNYDPGTYNTFKINTNSDKLFARFDWNLNANNTLMIRGVYTSGSGNNLERTATNFQFSSTDFIQHTTNINLVAELKSKFSNNVSNQLIISYIDVHEYRDFPSKLGASGNPVAGPAPFMDIDNGRIWLGTWREASIYNMKQKTFEFSDNVTWIKGANKFTFGTHNEFYNLSYGFINSWNGRWEYAGGLGSFLADKPSRIRGAFTTDAAKNDRNALYNDLPGSNYSVYLTSVYAQDEIALTRKFKLTGGVRVDYPLLNKNFTIDPALNSTPNYVSSDPTYSHTSFNELNNKWLGVPTLSPRIGFNYDIKGDQTLVLRGGTGIFVGRMPFAWLGYASTLTGNNFGNIDYKPGGKTVGLAIDPNTLKDTVNKYGGASASNTREVDMVDNNFKLPRVWRSSLALDVKFGNGYKLTLDAMYTKTLYDVKFQQINIKDSAQYYTSGPTQTPFYVGGKLNSAYSNVYFLSNTTEGYRYNLTAQISKSTTGLRVGKLSTFNLNWSFAYTYGVSKDVSNGIRNSFQSNYELNPSVNPESPSLAYSNFDLRHRIVATVGGTLNWNEFNSTSLTFFYSGQSGSPYSLIYTNAPFGNSSNAPLPYIPRDQSDIRLADYTRSDGSVYTAGQQWTDLDAFINGDAYLKSHRGQYAERNGLHTPWNHEVDMKLMHEFRFKGNNKQHGLIVSFDVFNVLNLLNNAWGHTTFVTNVNNYTVNFLKFANDANAVAPGKP